MLAAGVFLILFILPIIRSMRCDWDVVSFLGFGYASVAAAEVAFLAWIFLSAATGTVISRGSSRSGSRSM